MCPGAACKDMPSRHTALEPGQCALIFAVCLAQSGDAPNPDRPLQGAGWCAGVALCVFNHDLLRELGAPTRGEAGADPV
jgi:hypothetical protein